MMAQADGPDIYHGQTLTGKPFDPTWRLFSHKCSEGSNSGDSTFPSRWKLMRDTGFRWRGAYHWIRSDSSVAAQAANLCARIDAQGGLRRGEFVQLDWETTPNIANVTVAAVIEWCDRVETHFGRRCVAVYSSDWVPGFATWRSKKPDVPLWYANYNTGTSPMGGPAECAKFNAAVWQYTSNYKHPSIITKHADGTVTGFDMNQVLKPMLLDIITDQLVVPPSPTIDPLIAATGELMLYCYIDPNGTVWIGNGLARVALSSMDQFNQYVLLGNTGGGPKLISANGKVVTRIEDVAHVGVATIEALGRWVP